MNIIRNRIINFRVSEDEFRRLKAASTLQNARCLSDFARAATLRVAGNTDAEPDRLRSDTDIHALDRRLATLELHVARLVEALTDFRGEESDSPRLARVSSAMKVTTCD